MNEKNKMNNKFFEKIENLGYQGEINRTSILIFFNIQIQTQQFLIHVFSTPLVLNIFLVATFTTWIIEKYALYMSAHYLYGC